MTWALATLSAILFLMLIRAQLRLQQASRVAHRMMDIAEESAAEANRLRNVETDLNAALSGWQHWVLSSPELDMDTMHHAAMCREGARLGIQHLPSYPGES